MREIGKTLGSSQKSNVVGSLDFPVNWHCSEAVFLVISRFDNENSRRKGRSVTFGGRLFPLFFCFSVHNLLLRSPNRANQCLDPSWQHQ